MIRLFILFFLLLCCFVDSYAQQRSSYRLTALVFDSGGNISSSNKYRVHSIVGQAAQRNWNASVGYKLFSGLGCLFCHDFISTAVEPVAIPGVMHLYQNYPNPFNSSTTIRYELERPAEIEVSLYSLLGNKLTVLDSGFREAGQYNIAVDAFQLGSGVYVYRMTSEFGTLARGMVVMK